MIVPATIRYSDLLGALGIETIPGTGYAEMDWVTLPEVDVEECDIDLPCPLCGGEGPEEAPDNVNPSLIADFLAAVRSGDIATAQALVGRVFEAPDDIALVDRSLCRCAA